MTEKNLATTSQEGQLATSEQNQLGVPVPLKEKLNHLRQVSNMVELELSNCMKGDRLRIYINRGEKKEATQAIIWVMSRLVGWFKVPKENRITDEELAFFCSQLVKDYPGVTIEAVVAFSNSLRKGSFQGYRKNPAGHIGRRYAQAEVEFPHHYNRIDGPFLANCWKIWWNNLVYQHYHKKEIYRETHPRQPPPREHLRQIEQKRMKALPPAQKQEGDELAPMARNLKRAMQQLNPNSNAESDS